MENKFKFNTYDRVLTRDEDKDIWVAQQFECLEEDNNGFIYATIEGFCYKQCIPYNEETKHLHRTTEPYEPKYEPKRGDFIIVGSKLSSPYDQFIAIYKSEETMQFGNKKCNCVIAYASMAHHTMHKAVIIDGGGFDDSKVIRPANEKEKQLILDALHKQGKDWDSEKMEIVDYEWKPKKGEKVLLIFYEESSFSFKYLERWYNPDMYKEHFKRGLVLKIGQTVKAQSLCDKLNEAIKNIK